MSRAFAALDSLSLSTFCPALLSRASSRHQRHTGPGLGDGDRTRGPQGARLVTGCPERDALLSQHRLWRPSGDDEPGCPLVRREEEIGGARLAAPIAVGRMSADQDVGPLVAVDDRPREQPTNRRDRRPPRRRFSRPSYREHEGRPRERPSFRTRRRRIPSPCARCCRPVLRRRADRRGRRSSRLRGSRPTRRRDRRPSHRRS